MASPYQKQLRSLAVANDERGVSQACAPLRLEYVLKSEVLLASRASSGASGNAQSSGTVTSAPSPNATTSANNSGSGSALRVRSQQ